MAVQPIQAPIKQSAKSEEAYTFSIFAELEASAAKEKNAFNDTDITNMLLLMREGKRYLKKLNKKTVKEVTALKVTEDRLKKAMKKFKKLRKERDAYPKDSQSWLHVEIQIKKLNKELWKDSIQIHVKRNRIARITRYEKHFNDFKKTIEDASSPQQVDLYIAAIEKEQEKMMGNPKKEEDNPVALAKLIRFLEKKEKELEEKETFSKGIVGSVVGQVTSSAESSPLKLLHPYVPDSMERWFHEGVTLAQLKAAIKEAKAKKDEALVKILLGKSGSDKDALLNRMNLLDEMIKYAETSKHNFDKNINFSNQMYTASTMLLLLGTSISEILSTVPGANLISVALKKIFEFFGFSTLVAAQARDPNVPAEVSLAARRHYEALKQYKLADTVFALTGTAALASSAILGLFFTAIAVPAAPALLVAGSAFVFISNTISTFSSYKDYLHKKSVLERNKLYPKLSELQERLAKNDQALSKDEKAFLRDEFQVRQMKARTLSRFSTALGSGLAAVLAVGAVLAMVGFPPFGVAVMSAFAIGAVAVSAYSAYQTHKEKVLAKKAFKLNEAIQSVEISEAFDTIRVKNKSLSRLVPEPPLLEMGAHLEVPSVENEAVLVPKLERSHDKSPLVMQHEMQKVNSRDKQKQKESELGVVMPHGPGKKTVE